MSRTLPFGVVVLSILACPPAHAVDPATAQQLEALSQQVAALQQEVAVLRSMLSRDGSGNVLQTTIGEKTEKVGRSLSVTVGADRQEKIGGSAVDYVAGEKSLQVGGGLAVSVQRNQLVNVGANASEQVAGSVSEKIGGNLATTVATGITLTAGEQITLRTGAASMVLRKDGTVLIEGSNVRITSAGDLALKGARVVTN
jgi:type VI secretion system secreted protein VgrG